MKPVAVIILNYNGMELLRRFLPSVIANTSAELADVIVADNGSTDGSLELLGSEYPEVRVIAFDANYGYAGGYNRAIEATRYRYTLLLNSDVETPPDWLEPLYDYMCAHHECGACQPKILSERRRDMFEYAGASGGFLDRHGYPYCRGRIFDTVEPDSGQYDDPRTVFWASGAALMVDTELYIKVGGLDESFFAHMEEIDLCWRMQLAGRTVAVVPQSAVYHLGGATLAAADPRKTYLNFRNSLLMLRKNLPPGPVRRRLLLRRRLLDTLALLNFAARGRWAHARAVLKAHNDYRRMAGSLPAGTATRSLLAADPDSSRNIIAQYYLRGRKTYTSLK